MKNYIHIYRNLSPEAQTEMSKSSDMQSEIDYQHWNATNSTPEDPFFSVDSKVLSSNGMEST